MFAIRRTDRKRRRYVHNVRHLLSQTFNLSDHALTEHDRIWDAWLGLKRGRLECGDLCELLRTEVNDAFRARAITILLAPELKLSPFAWQDTSSNYLSCWDYVRFAQLSPRLLSFTVALLEINLNMALATENLRETVSGYNRYILQALTVLSEDASMAADLFERYQLNDVVAYWSLDSASGYNPFGDILRASIPEKWKRLADDKMRTVIHAEQEGRAQPRGDWEKALKSYARHIQSCLYMKPFPYSLDLFASQVDFVLGLPNTVGQRLFESFDVHTILVLLIGDARKELRRRFARHMMLEDHGKYGAFGVYNEDTAAAAILMLNEFGDEDPELGDRLRGVIAERDRRVVGEQTAANERQAQVDIVMARMR